jgi:hypothetical protein
LDQKVQGEEAVFVHPLVNTASLRMSPTALSAAVRCDPPLALGFRVRVS